MATHSGLQFGKDVVFTYGPYGYLSVPAFFFSWTGFASLLYSVLVTIGFATTVIHLGRRSFTLPGAFMLAYLALLLTYFDPAELVVVVAFLWCLSWLSEPRRDKIPRWLLVSGGAFAALQLLVKFDAGVAAIVIVGLTAWGVGGRRFRNEMIVGGGFLVAFTVLWLAARQHMSGIVPYIRHSLQIASGYSAAMSAEAPRRPIEYGVVVLLVFLVVPLILFRGRLPAKSKLVVLLLIAVMTYTEFLHGFIRHDWAHSAPFLVFAAILPVAIAWKDSLRMVMAACCLIPLALLVSPPMIGSASILTAGARPRTALDDLKLVVDPSYRQSQVAAARIVMRQRLDVDPVTLGLLQGQTVAIDPVEISAIWAYELDWRPVPVFQMYSAYTTPLDLLNAAALWSASGPSRILRTGTLLARADAVDGRYPFFDSPRYQLAIVCNYADIHETKQWEVLGRIPNRCSSPKLLGSAAATASQSVPIPQPRGENLIYASIIFRPSLKEELLTTLFKPSVIPSVTLDNRSYRLISATASGPLLLCIPRAVASPEYGGGTCPSTISVERAGPFQIRFYSIRLDLSAVP